MIAPKICTYFDSHALPILEIELGKIARTGSYFDQPEKNLVGNCVSCDLVGLLQSARQCRESIDQLLARFLAKGFSEWALKSRFIVGVSIAGNQFEII